MILQNIFVQTNLTLLDKLGNIQVACLLINLTILLLEAIYCNYYCLSIYLPSKHQCLLGSVFANNKFCEYVCEMFIVRYIYVKELFAQPTA